jgi:hypothetical protein
MCKAKGYIEALTPIYESVFKEYDRIYNKVNELDYATQDVLHTIENSKFDASTGYRLARKIKDIRNERRVLKNEIETLDIIIPLIKSMKDKTKNVRTMLDEKITSQHNWVYKPRVLKEKQTV